MKNDNFTHLDMGVYYTCGILLLYCYTIFLMEHFFFAFEYNIISKKEESVNTIFFYVSFQKNKSHNEEKNKEK